jgi:hypothetical protein
MRLDEWLDPELQDAHIAALEQERDDLQKTCAVVNADRARLREIVEMAWKGYGYDQEWDCDCPVCAAIRTRTPYDTEGEK